MDMVSKKDRTSKHAPHLVLYFTFLLFALLLTHKEVLHHAAQAHSRVNDIDSRKAASPTRHNTVHLLLEQTTICFLLVAEQ